jgi:hypothetical protein
LAIYSYKGVIVLSSHSRVLLKLGSILLDRVALFNILDYSDSLKGFIKYTEDIADSLTEVREVLYLGLNIVEIVIGVVLF